MHSLIKDCYTIEDLASKTYLKLSQNGDYPDAVRKMFARLSSDEKNHAGNLSLLMQTSVKKTDVSYNVSWDKINKALKFAEDAFARAGESSLDVEQALAMAVAMEELFIKAHAHNVLEFHDQKLVELFSKLGDDDRAHLDILNKCLAWWRSEGPRLSQNQ